MATWAELWELADSERLRHEAWAGVCSLRATEAVAASDSDAASVYSGAALDHSAKATKFAAIQKMIGRVEGSKIMREEIARLAEIERAASAAAEAEVDAEEAKA